MQKYIITGVVLLAAVLGAFGYYSTHKQAQSFGSFNVTGAGTYLLQSSISSTQTTITLTSFTEPGSGIPYTMAYINTNIVYGTLSPSSGNSEFVSFTGITQNSNGTATLTGVTRGQSRSPGSGGCVASTTLARAYPGQTQFILSNSPCFYSQFAVKQNSQSISGIWNFDIYPEASSTLGNATTSRQFLTFGQAQSLASQGAATGTESIAGIVRLGTALQAASSTFLGVNIPLVLQTKYATDTPQNCTTASPCVPVTAPNGFLRSTFIDKTATYLWTALHTFSAGFLSTASSTINATTTIAATSPTSSALTLNTIAYGFPSSQSASTFLKTNGSGALSWSIPDVSTLFTNPAVLTSTSGTASTSLLSVTIPAGTINAINTALKGDFIFFYPNGAVCFQQILFGNGSASSSLGGFGQANPTINQVTFTLLATSTNTETGFTTVYTPGVSTGMNLYQFFAGQNTAAQTYIEVNARCTTGTETLQGGTLTRYAH